MAVTIDGTNGVTTPGLTDTADASVAGNLTVTGNTTGTGYIRASGVATNLYPLVSGTSVSASGTSVDFTGIPSWVRRITVLFQGVSGSGTSPIQIQIGSGSVSTSGYVGSAWVHSTTGISAASFTSGLVLVNTSAAARNFQGIGTLATLGSNSWVGSVTVEGNDGGGGGGATAITLGGVLDRVRITTVNGTDTFDAGTLNILYE